MDKPKRDPTELVLILNACGGKGNGNRYPQCTKCPLRNEDHRCYYAWTQAAELIEAQAAEIERLKVI